MKQVGSKLGPSISDDHMISGMPVQQNDYRKAVISCVVAMPWSMAMTAGPICEAVYYDKVVFASIRAKINGNFLKTPHPCQDAPTSSSTTP